MTSPLCSSSPTAWRTRRPCSRAWGAVSLRTRSPSARLDKYFLQILAGVTNANVVLDPHGNLGVGDTHVIPFWMSEADMGLDVFVLTPYPWYLDFELQTPDGTMITPASAGAEPNIEFVQVDHMGYYRIGLRAIPADAPGTHQGLWNAVLRIGGKRQVGMRDAYYA